MGQILRKPDGVEAEDAEDGNPDDDVDEIKHDESRALRGLCGAA